MVGAVLSMVEFRFDLYVYVTSHRNHNIILIWIFEGNNVGHLKATWKCPTLLPEKIDVNAVVRNWNGLGSNVGKSGHDDMNTCADIR